MLVTSAERVLRRIDHVQKSVVVFLILVDVAEWSAVTDQRAVVDEQIERLVRVKLKTTAATEITTEMWSKK